MDKNNLIGITLVFLLFFIWAQYNAPSPEELAERERIQDSIKLAQVQQDSTASISDDTSGQNIPQSTESDSVRQARLQTQFGAFANGMTGEEQTSFLENDLFKVIFTNKGGRIKEVILKKYHKLDLNEEREEVQQALKMLEDEKNRFEFQIPLDGNQVLSSADLYFEPQLKDSVLTFRMNAGPGQYIEQQYTIQSGRYNIDYDIQINGMNLSAESLKFTWINYLDKLERNTTYERNYSAIYYKEGEDSPDHCSCTGDDVEDSNEPLRWISHSNQFFNTTLIAEASFNAAVMETTTIPAEGEDLKKLKSVIDIPYENGQAIALKMYVGPNEFDRLSTYNMDLEDIIPYGSSIFGTINRWIIRPLFGFLSGFIGSKGIVILILTLIVKLLLYPLSYKMLHSQSKMGALKPRIEALKAKLGDDQQQQQMETMKLYREFGVSPLGGCFPIMLQMPIWFALYRFFPASIEFRQAPFLWATDLSSFDVFAYLPFSVPFYGEHISMFTLLWAVTTVIYTYYNTRHMDMSVNPMMKYMQYFMPIMFLFFFNNFASGLSCY
ncbi:MAG: membrane protein insertase YidC, partial [Bacteroidota bacterium]